MFGKIVNWVHMRALEIRIGLAFAELFIVMAVKSWARLKAAKWNVTVLTVEDTNRELEKRGLIAGHDKRKGGA